jgi:hypothetical protein
MTYYKFVSWDVPAFETILTGRIPAALLAADNGNLQLKSNVIEIMEVKKD